MLVSPLRRSKELARLLTDTAHGDALLPDAGAQLTKTLMAKLDGLAAQHVESVAANVANLETVDVRRTRLGLGGAEVARTTTSIGTHASDLVRDTGRIVNAVKEGVGKDYWAHRAARRDDDEDLLDVRTSVAALFLVDDVVAELEAAATTWVRTQLARFRVDIEHATGATRDGYRRVQEQTTTPEVVGVDLRDNVTAPTKDRNGAALPTYPGHVYAAVDGTFPAVLNEWERAVVTTESARPTFLAWYRNPAQANPAALRIAYRDDTGGWASLQVDFLVVSRLADGNLGVSIVDPHGDHLADARAKLQALADYAETHGTSFIRIESVAMTNVGLAVLDFQDPDVRAAVRGFEGGQVTALYESDVARPYA